MLRRWFWLILIQYLGSIKKIAWADEAFTWRSGSPENLPQLHGLNVECGQDDMVVYLKFDTPFDGSIYSKGPERCVHVAAHSHITEATFTIEYNNCNTRSDPKGKYYENTIVVQYDDAVIEAWDIAKKIRCEWHDGYEKSAFKQPITISDLDVVEMNFQGDDVDCWLEIQDGKGPWSSKVEGLVPLGSPLTLVVAIQDAEGHFDMRVKSCKAHDGRKHPVYLTDEDGCVLRPKMMSPFTKTRDTKGTASVVAYSHFYAFKFPETVDVNVQCTVEICRHGCPDSCNRDTHFASAKKPALHEHTSGEQSVTEDIPTYRDSYPHSSVITNKPHRKSNDSTSEEKENATANKDLEISNSHPTHNFLPPYPPNLFDVLNDHLEDHFEDYDQFEDRKAQDSDYEEDKLKNDIEKIPDFLKEHFSSRKGFPSNHQTSKEFSDDQQLEENLQMKAEPLIQHNNDTTDSSEDESSTMMTTDYATAISSSSISVENDAGKFEVFTQPPLLKTTDGIESNFITDGVDSHITENSTTSDHDEGSPENVTPQYQEDLVEVFAPDKRVDDFQIPIHSDEIALESEEYPLKEYYEEYKISPVQGRMPIKSHKSSETPKKLLYHNYKPFKPPFPLPPLTFYNGIPLHYYHQQKAHMERKAHQRKYDDSIMFHGTYHGRRYRREIGEKEQLGLQQSFRVISPTDFDFIIPNNKKPKVEQVETQMNSVCMTSTSFTAGLGLLLLANICGAGIATFLAYHYFIHRKTKVKALELLGKDVSS